MDCDFDQHSLNTTRLVLAHIVRDAPLAQILNTIITGVEEQNPGMVLGLFLKEEGHLLRFFSIANLPQAYRSAIDEMIANGMLQSDDENIEASGILSQFCNTAKEHGPHEAPLSSIPFGTHGFSGFFISHYQQLQNSNTHCQQAINDAAALASIAIDRHNAEARIKRAEDALHQNGTIMALAI